MPCKNANFFRGLRPRLPQFLNRNLVVLFNVAFFKTSRRGVLIVIWASLDFCHDTTTTTTTTFFYPPSFSRDELFIFILYFDSPFFCFQQVDFKVERLQTKSSLCLLLCAELTSFIFWGVKAEMSSKRTLFD